MYLCAPVGSLFHSLEISLVDSPMWCNVVKVVHRCVGMKAKKGEGKITKVQNVPAVRASISFPPSVYETLETIAKEKKVSLAWVVREAAEKYIAEKWPLFARS
jgi:predicted DNA-binding protein